MRLARVATGRRDGAGMSDLYLPPSFGTWVVLDDANALTVPAPVQVHADPDAYEPGSYWSHLRPDGRNCGLGQISFAPGHHRLESTDPLTVGGSLLCLNCKRHGFVTAGKWVSA